MAITINISTDFSEAPGARFRTDGPKSGQEFFEDILKTKYEEAKQKGEKLILDMDNTWGYASSFLSGSFGQLSKDFGAQEVLIILEFVSKDDPLLIEKIKAEILKPNTK